MNAAGTVLITGGSRGIGAAVARGVAARGHDVCVTYATQRDVAQALVDELRGLGVQACAVQADLGEAGAVESIFSQWSPTLAPLIGLVNNAGITGPLGPFGSVDVATMRRVFDVNVLGLMSLTQRVVQRWRAANVAGRIVNVSSIAALTGAPGEYVHYAASKAAVEAFTVGLAKELAETGIRVNAVSPGTTLTDIHAAAGEPGRPQRVAARIPLRRAADAEEIAEAVLWLLSPRSSYATGSVLKIAGGL